MIGLIQAALDNPSKVLGAHLTHSANIPIPHGAATELGSLGLGIFDTVVYDTCGMFDPGDRSRLTVPKAGLWLAWSRGSFQANSTGARDVTIKKNFIPPPEPPNGGIAYSGLFPPPVGSFVGSGHTPMTVELCEEGDYFQFSCYQTSGGSLNLNALQGVGTDLGAIYLGPA